MITNVNKSNSMNYQKYFEELNDYLTHNENDADYITSIDQVFEQISAIREKDQEEYDGKIMKIFSRLPLDEEPFYIDLNTRAIKVPVHFQKNGISVKGDQVAEVVYFKCERYFDNVDLAGKEIYIQYINAKGDNRILKTPLIDVESEPGYIIFEWPVTMEATIGAGSLRFAVRFCGFDDESNLTYSLASLTQSVKVNESINFDFTNGLSPDNIEDGFNDLMVSRLVKSNPNVPTVSKASNPTFLIKLNEESRNLIVDANGFTNGAIDLEVLAINDEGGKITYRIYKQDIKGGNEILLNSRKLEDNSIELIPFKEKYQLISETSPVEGKPYYNKIDEDNYELLGSIQSFSAGTEYFEKVFYYTVNEAGKYYITADNRVRFTLTEEIPTPYYNKEENEAKKFLIIPSASKINIPSSFKLRALTGENLNATISSPDLGGKITYKWFKKDDMAEEAEELSKVTPIASFEDEGYYQVEIENYLNKTTEKVSSSFCRVTKETSLPKLSYSENIAASLEKGSYFSFFSKTEVPNGKFNLEADVVWSEDNLNGDKKRIDEDNVTYQWYQYAYNGTKKNTDLALSDAITKANAGTYNVDESDENDIKLTDATENYLNVANCAPGIYYYCLITNHYNDNTKTVSSRFFTFGQN